MLKPKTKVRIFSLVLTISICINQCFTGSTLFVSANTNTVKTFDNQEPPTVTASITPDATASATATVSASPASTTGAAVTSNPEATEPTASDPTTTEPVVSEAPQLPTANIRFMFTTDLHGALTTTNYETGATKSTGTLARCATLIKQARAEKASGNTFLFDVGDQSYDYSTDHIYEQDRTAVQPIYSAMKSLGYDAITLGNHEFDYSLDYIQNQIANSGLQDICVVSNVKYTTTQKNVWKENLMLNKTVTLSDGSMMDLKIGVIGETQPGLSTKRTKYTNTLTTEDIVKSTQAQAQALKAQGADLIVVLSHSGIGEENPADKASMASYALTKIPEVDVVLAGHAHQYFPATETHGSSEKYYALPNVDRETGLANGKNLIMIGDKGASIGIADLTVSRNPDNTLQISNRETIIRDASSDVAVDEDINNNYMGQWRNVFVSSYSNILGEISHPESYNNFFAPLEDNSIMQLINNAKMKRALKIIQTEKTDYVNLPVISASTYIKCGNDDDKDFISFSDYFLESYLSTVQIYRTGIFLYTISGKQLKEWMEWSASAYKTTDSSTNITVGGEGTYYSQTLLDPQWNSDFSNFYVFDGLEYTIDTSVDPRYNFEGQQISGSSRITSLTRNGVPINDTDTFIMATNKLDTNTNNLITEIAGQRIYGAASLRWRTVLKDFLEEYSLNSTLGSIADNNWQVTTKAGSTQIVKSGLTSGTIAEKKEWITDTVGSDTDFVYYTVDMSKKNTTDTTGPNIVATALSDELSHSAVTISVQTNDRSGVDSVKYAKGKFTTNADIWLYTNPVNSSFNVKENGIYTIMATDKLGNRSVSYFRISNINADTISAPIVDSFTNRKVAVTGTAPAKSTVYVKISGGKTYSTTADANGAFSCTVPAQKADTQIYVYAVDNSGRTSPRVTITTARTAPNKPTLHAINSNSKKVTGNTNDTYAYPILYVEDKNAVYVPETDGKALYKASSAYDAGCRIVEVPCKVTSSGAFTFTLPVYLKGDTVATLYSLDNSSRKSNTTTTKVVQKKPPKPSLATSYVSNATNIVKTYCGERCTMQVKIGKKVYKHESVEYDSETGEYLYVTKIPRTNSGTKIRFYASNEVGKSAVVSAPRKETAPNAPTISSVNLAKHTVKGSVHFIDSDFEKSTLSTSKTKVYAKVGSKTYKGKLTKKGTYTVKIPTLAKGQTVAIWATNVNGTSPTRKKTV